jgi:hypothetical protein
MDGHVSELFISVMVNQIRVNLKEDQVTDVLVGFNHQAPA